MNEWISVKERLPSKKGQYLVLLKRTTSKEFGGNTKTIRITRWLGNEWRMPFHIPEWINEQIKDEITHWQPLPEPPKENP